MSRPARSIMSGATMSEDNNSKSALSGLQQKVELLPQVNFYATLVKMKIRKSEKANDNLSNFLKFNEMNKDMILFRKLIKVIEEFLRSHFLKSFGFTKKKFDANF